MKPKRCPICGSKPYMEKNLTTYFQCRCTHCYKVEGSEIYTDDFWSFAEAEKDAIKSWNEEVKEIEKYLKNKPKCLASNEDAKGPEVWIFH